MIQRIMMPAILAVLALNGCSFIKLTPDGKKARVLSTEEVSTCRELGQLSVATRLIFPRPGSSIQQELIALGRNNAVTMGGDTIVPESADIDGRQIFNVYKCVDPNG